MVVDDILSGVDGSVSVDRYMGSMVDRIANIVANMQDNMGSGNSNWDNMCNSSNTSGSSSSSRGSSGNRAVMWIVVALAVTTAWV